MKDKRERRLNKEFARYIYQILKEEVKDPDLTEMFTIMDVVVTDDLKYADVFVSVFSANEEKKQKTFNAIKSSAGFIRKRISTLMHIRTVPEFRFKEDDSLDYGRHIDEILEKINEKHD